MELMTVSVSELFIQILQIKEALTTLDELDFTWFLVQRFIAAKDKK